MPAVDGLDCAVFAVAVLCTLAAQSCACASGLALYVLSCHRMQLQSGTLYDLRLYSYQRDILLYWRYTTVVCCQLAMLAASQVMSGKRVAQHVSDACICLYTSLTTYQPWQIVRCMYTVRIDMKEGISSAFVEPAIVMPVLLGCTASLVL